MSPATRGVSTCCLTAVLLAGGCSDGDRPREDAGQGDGAALDLRRRDSGAEGGGAPFGTFARGINLTYRNPAFGDAQRAELAAAAGCNGVRVKLPEYHLTRWGSEIEVADVQRYVDLGMGSLVGFLIGPTRSHSTAPASVQDWELDFWMPANLHEPIFNGDGSVNADNFWAAYVELVVRTYSPWIKVWEIWNEPDWIPDYTTAARWATAAPTKAELPRFNGSVFDYVRMLRVAHEVARKVDPEAEIAVGGLGYPTFMSAVARYTDNPVDGSVTAEYPKRGAEWFEVVDFHYYPIYAGGNSDAGVRGFLQQKADFAAALSALGVSGKRWLATETGAPHQAVGTYPGGAEYARNYAVKVMVSAELAGMFAVHWFQLSDTGTSADPYVHMGLYQDIENVSAVSAAVRTDAGEALRTMAQLLGDAKGDPAATSALALPATVCGGAFTPSDGATVAVLWACGAATGETATATYDLAASGPMTTHAWDAARTGARETLAPTGGKVTLQLTASPIFVTGL